jgi:lipopolysaccharide/colanic/teichoic acid biosynthesis glycosyltransferase
LGKRAFDIIVSAAALVALFPLLAIVAVAVRLDSPGPILYRATRVGCGGHIFKLCKFRSMIANADRYGTGITSAGDVRITRVGRVLRRTKLDELPQLINVLRGEMSLVGPRPEDPRYVALYTSEQRGVLQIRPGITSLASVQYRHEESILIGADWETRYIRDIMPAKLLLDLDYARNPSLRRDIPILFQTIAAIFARSHTI